MKKLIVLYNGSQDNAEINNSDYKQFYKVILNKNNTGTGVDIDVQFCPNKDVLFDYLQKLTKHKNRHDLYLHFSSHGTVQGIPYVDWIIKNDELAKLLEHESIKFCFFSSCRSADLVQLVNKHNIPIVIGTKEHNDIGNDWAINFQVEFYQRLLENSLTFSLAFAQALIAVSERGSSDNSITLSRGEGAKSEVEESQINKLQIVFLKERFKQHYLAPPNFLKKMEDIDNNRPVVLTWFNDTNYIKKFKEDFVANDLNERLELIVIPENEIELLNQDKMAFMMHEPILLLIITDQDNKMPEAIKEHLQEINWEITHYRVLICAQDNIDLNKVINNPEILSEINKNTKIYKFKAKPSELLENNPLLANNKFLSELLPNDLDYYLRTQITLDFEVPSKNFLYSDFAQYNDKYLRIYTGRFFNENLINFIINNIKKKFSYKRPVIVVDSFYSDPDEMFNSTLLKEIEHTYGINEQGLRGKFMSLLDEEAIFIFKNRNIPLQKWTEICKNFLLEIEKIIEFKESPDVEIKPAYFFFLQEDNGFQLNPRLNRAYIKNFENPEPVNAESIKRWCDRHNLENSTYEIEQSVKRIANSINLDQYITCCPSSVIEFVCNTYNISPKKIIRI
ncbi:hypothetical protein ES711_10425 [Gelidibacter salicanalis]|uniref:Uncharacterized protein n=1 Tax=Gelidibacter salicanalis TaxID=291193 RepID=A0A5C7AH14_9FLAO|nr:hypothetical protein [Gelidibacter salicanalis]TXE07838.1 hypothetical protein ES711_10425 [Gelidibacter salicanalis]